MVIRIIFSKIRILNLYYSATQFYQLDRLLLKTNFNQS